MTGSVMIVEDDADIAGNVKLVLEEEGYRVTTAPHGQAALALLAAEPLPSVILLDLMMPVMSGYDFREAQLADPRIASIPVVLMTADGHVVEKSARLGVTTALGKPFDIDELLGVVGRFAG